MKLLTKLRNLSTFSSPLVEDLLVGGSRSSESIINPDLFQETEEEAFGVGAAMPQDVAGLSFLDGQRRRIPEVHEEFPPYCLCSSDSDSALEQEF